MGGVQRYFKENRELFLQLKDQVDKAMSGFNEVLDKNSVLVDEEVEFRKEQLELQEKREEALKELEKSTENE